MGCKIGVRSPFIHPFRISTEFWKRPSVGFGFGKGARPAPWRRPFGKGKGKGGKGKGTLPFISRNCHRSPFQVCNPGHGGQLGKPLRQREEEPRRPAKQEFDHEERGPIKGLKRPSPPHRPYRHFHQHGSRRGGHPAHSSIPKCQKLSSMVEVSRSTFIRSGFNHTRGGDKFRPPPGVQNSTKVTRGNFGSSKNFGGLSSSRGSPKTTTRGKSQNNSLGTLVPFVKGRHPHKFRKGAADFRLQGNKFGIGSTTISVGPLEAYFSQSQKRNVGSKVGFKKRLFSFRTQQESETFHEATGGRANLANGGSSLRVKYTAKPLDEPYESPGEKVESQRLPCLHLPGRHFGSFRISKRRTNCIEKHAPGLVRRRNGN